MVLDTVMLKTIGGSTSIGFDVNLGLVAAIGAEVEDLVQFKIIRVKKPNGQVKEINFTQTKKITKQNKIIIKATYVKGLNLEEGDILDIDYIQKIEPSDDDKTETDE